MAETLTMLGANPSRVSPLWIIFEGGKPLKLISLLIQNFKGIEEFTFGPNGESLSVYGNNGTGKTTLPDAFCWLLFGKDSDGKAAFELKPLDADNNPIHNLVSTHAPA